MDKDGGNIPRRTAWVLCQQRYRDGNNRTQYGAGSREYLPGTTFSGVPRLAEGIQHPITRQNPTDLGELWGGPEYAGNIGRILGELGSGYQVERLSWATFQGNPQDNTLGDHVSNTIQYSGRQCGYPLDITNSVGRGVHTIPTGTRCGTELGGSSTYMMVY